MIVTAIGDIHWMTKWEKIVEKEIDISDKIIFVWDYFDAYSKNITVEDEYINFEKILELKKEYWEKIILLLWNHDLHYLDGIDNKYDRFSEINYDKINSILTNSINDNLLQIATKIDNVLYTHAWVTKTWLSDNNIQDTNNNIDLSINALFLKNEKAFDFIQKEGYISERKWDNIFQWPLWVRDKSLLADKLDIKQVVWHTRFSCSMTFSDIAFIDLLWITNRYLNIEDWNFIDKRY